MVKVVEGGHLAATRARFSPGVRTGLHALAAEASDAPRPITSETAKTSKGFFTFPLLFLRRSRYQKRPHHSSTASAAIRVMFASDSMRASTLEALEAPLRGRPLRPCGLGSYSAYL